jgi:hypothetical protein
VTVESNDLTGKDPSAKDVREAEAVVIKFILQITKLPPELAVQMPNILRCLRHYEFLRTKEGGS